MFRLAFYLSHLPLILGLLFIVTVLVTVLGYSAFWLARNALSPTTRIRARALRKRSNQWDVSAEGVDCYVTFRFDGREMEFHVPMETYVACEEGSEGLLVFKGEKFKHFIRRVE